MPELLALSLASLRAAVRDRGDLIAENLLLLHQLAALSRPTRQKPRLRRRDRLLWVLARRLRRDWRRHLVLVRPGGILTAGRNQRRRRAGTMIVVSNRIPVAEGHEGEFAERFRTRAHLVEHHPGFVRLEIGRPERVAFHGEPMGGSRYHVVLTYWESKAHFLAWVQSEDFRTAHAQRTPEGLFAGESVFELHEIIQSTEAPR